MDFSHIIEFIQKNLSGAIIAGVGGFIHYIYKVSMGEKFIFTKLVINIILAGWLGYLCQIAGISSIYTSIAGFCCYPLLNMIEKKGPQILEMLFTNSK